MLPLYSILINEHLWNCLALPLPRPSLPAYRLTIDSALCIANSMNAIYHTINLFCFVLTKPIEKGKIKEEEKWWCRMTRVNDLDSIFSNTTLCTRMDRCEENHTIRGEEKMKIRMRWFRREKELIEISHFELHLLNLLNFHLEKLNRVNHLNGFVLWTNHPHRYSC